jgi:Na+-transporting NADH:ubiquinone oxidoreductase subunit D
LGYSALLIVIATFREIFGAGKWFGIQILPTVTDGGWYVPNGLLLLPPSAFFVIGMIIWGMRAWKKNQVEKVDFKIAPNTSVNQEIA